MRDGGGGNVEVLRQRAMPVDVGTAGMVVLLLAERAHIIHRIGTSRTVLVQLAQSRINHSVLGALDCPAVSKP